MSPRFLWMTPAGCWLCPACEMMTSGVLGTVDTGAVDTHETASNEARPAINDVNLFMKPSFLDQRIRGLIHPAWTATRLSAPSRQERVEEVTPTMRPPRNAGPPES